MTPIYYEYKRNTFYNLFGGLGISIDQVVNSQETKLLIQKLYKAHLASERYFMQRQIEQDRLMSIKNANWLEKQLGESLRVFIKFGDRFPILAWFRKHIKDICFWLAVSYYASFVISRIKSQQ